MTQKIRKKILEAWEKPLATGYERDKSLTDADTSLDNTQEDIPGETEFPTYEKLKKRVAELKQSDRDFTQSYAEFSGHSEGEK